MEKLYLVIPCYNEEEVLKETSKRLKVKMEELIEKKKISKESKIVFVNDGSKDNTCSRKKDTFFKSNSALMFYRMMKWMGVQIVYNHADYRLMSKRALDGLAEFEEVNLFLRGMVPLVGYQSTTVSYERAERFAGESKYPLKKMY